MTNTKLMPAKQVNLVRPTGRATKTINSFQQLDYSAIPKQQRWNNVRYISVGLGVSALFSIILAVLGGLSAGGVGEGALDGLATLVFLINGIAVIPLIIASLVAGIVMMLTSDDFIGKYLGAFAASNGFTAQSNDYVLNKDGSIFAVGDDPSEKNIITGNYRGYDFELFEHSYWTGSDKNRSQHRLTILNLKLPKKVPHLVIDSRLEDATARSGSVLPIMFDNKQKLTLEGDFSKYFNVYSPRNYQVSALSLITPDVMQTFLTKLHQVDVELVNDRLYIYDPDVMNSSEQIADMFEAADAVIDEWSAKLKRANIYASKAQQQIHATESAQPVKLKRGGLVPVIVMIIAIILLQVLRALAEASSDPVPSMTFLIIFPITLIIIITRQIIVSRRRTAFTKRYGRLKD